MVSTVFDRPAVSARVVDHALAGSRHDVFWLADAPGARYPSLRGRLDADLLVVGGGFTGLWTALLAKERDPDARVVLVDAGTIGWAASGRNAGVIASNFTHGYQNGAVRWPDEIDRMEEMGRENLAEIAALIDHYDMKVDLEHRGSMAVATEPYQVEALRSAPRDGERVFFDRDEVRAQVASPTYLAGYWRKNDAYLTQPAKLAAELARVISELGVIVLEHSAIRELEDDGRKVVAHGDAGSVRASSVALGTNAFPSLLRRARLLTVPVYEYMLATEPLTAAQLDSIGWKDRQNLADIANQLHYYRLSSDDRIIFGGYDAIYHPGGKIKEQYEDRPDSHRRLTAHLLTTFPQLEGLRISHRWAGVIDTSSRFCAFYGSAYRGKVAYAAGYTGLGVGASRFAGNVMLDKLAGLVTERTELRLVKERPVPFPPEPFATIGITATVRSLDRADHNRGKRNLLLRTLDALGVGFSS